ncbi:hypothetical protein Droror1_Dr00027244 [Drosera rotundifolia]
MLIWILISMVRLWRAGWRKKDMALSLSCSKRHDIRFFNSITYAVLKLRNEVLKDAGIKQMKNNQQQMKVMPGYHFESVYRVECKPYLRLSTMSSSVAEQVGFREFSPQIMLSLFVFIV